MDDKFRTIVAESEGLYKEKGSKFLAFAYPVETENQVKDIVSGIKEKYYDARHHCYAYRLGADKLRFRAVDDGEPSSTAGKPILGQIVSNDLTNILIVVVRYFGGIKLGVSGLINAYKDAAYDAIRNAEIIEKTENVVIKISFSYLAMNDVMKVIKDMSPNVLERNFEIACEMILSIRKSEVDVLCDRLISIDSVITDRIYDI